MTMKGARRIFRKELHGYPITFRAWVREAVKRNPSLAIGATGKLERIIRGPIQRSGEIRR